MRFNLNTFSHTPWRVFSYSMAAAVLAAIIACGGGGPSTTPTPTQSSGVGQPTETEAPAATPTQEAQQESSVDDDQQTQAAAATSTREATQEPAPGDDPQDEAIAVDATPEATQVLAADNDQQESVPTPTPTQEASQEPAADDDHPIPSPTAAATPTSTPTPTPSPSPNPTLQPTPEPTPDLRPDRGEVGTIAPEFRGITNWINSPALTMHELRGRVVLIDFWTYSCVNCIRTLPYLKEWHDKYADKGLTIVGVHRPEFEFEKVTENVVRSVEEHGLGWPIAQDNDDKTWRDYASRGWPTKLLVDQHGVIQFRHFGEGQYLKTEQLIRDLLEEADVDLSDVEIGANERPARDPRSRVSDPETRQTRELYGGYRRNNGSKGPYVLHNQYFEGPNRTVNYQDPGDHLNQFLYLQGLWTNGDESIRHARETENYEDYIALKFAAITVNAVVDPEDADPFDVRVTIDGRPLSEEEAGPDVVVADGQSFFTVDEPRMYEVVALPEYGIHELTLSSNSDDFSLFAFTFGSYERGP